MKGLVIFDLDGTLVCTHQHLIKAVNETLREFGFPTVDNRKIISLIGENSEVFCKSIASDCREMDNFISAFREKERFALQKNAQLYSGVLELLFALRQEGFTLAICSNGSREYIECALRTTNIRNMFQYMLSSQEFTSKAEAICNLIYTSQCENVVMVGDQSADLKAAQVNHIPFISAMYGYGTADEMADASFLAKHRRIFFLWLCSLHFIFRFTSK